MALTRIPKGKQIAKDPLFKTGKEAETTKAPCGGHLTDRTDHAAEGVRRPIPGRGSVPRNKVDTSYK
jgi:hypothetical protein